MRTSPLILNAIMYDAIFPWSSSVLRATIIVSLVCGMKRNGENPCVGLSGPILMDLTSVN